MSKFQVGDRIVRDYKGTCDPFRAYAHRRGINYYGTFTVSCVLSARGNLYLTEFKYLAQENYWRLETPYSKEDCL